MAGNPLRNASFELGTANYGVVRYASSGSGYLKPELDATTKVHGQTSLKFVNPNADTIYFSSHEFSLGDGGAYTLSWYMKSDQPVKIRCATLASPKAGGKGNWLVNANVLSPTTEWKRYECHFTAQGDAPYHVQFRWGNSDQGASTATVWFDALQLDEGVSAKAFAPGGASEAALVAPERVAFDKNPLSAKLLVVNYGAVPRKTTASFNLLDTTFPELKLPPEKAELTVQPGETASCELKFSPDRYGCFEIHGKTTCEGVEESLWPLTFAVVHKPSARTPDLSKEFEVGLDCSFGSYASHVSLLDDAYCGLASDLNAYFDFLGASGVKLLRGGNYGTKMVWKLIEREPGRYDWRKTDLLVEMAGERHMAVMPVLGNMFYLRDDGGKPRSKTSFPDHVLKKSRRVKNPVNCGAWDGLEPAQEDWARYVSAFSSHYKGRIAAYEITNEPNICMAGEDYANYLKTAAATIKANDPKALVVGGGVTTDLNGKTEAFTEALVQSGALKLCDALSFHPYGARQEENGAIEALRALRQGDGKARPGLPLWCTELYYLWGRSNDADVVLDGTRPCHLVRRALLDLGEGVRQGIYTNDRALLCNELTPSWGKVRDYACTALIPNALYAAHSSVANFFAGATPVERPPWPQGLACYLYKDREGGEIAAFWNYGVEKATLTLQGERLELFDLFGNPLALAQELPLTENPCFLRGADLSKTLRSAEIKTFNKGK